MVGSCQELHWFSDGDGHTIYNLGVKTTEDHAGLFGTLDLNGIAKNLIFVNPTVEVTNTNQYAGVLAGDDQLYL